MFRIKFTNASGLMSRINLTERGLDLFVRSLFTVEHVQPMRYTAVRDSRPTEKSVEIAYQDYLDGREED